MWEIGDNGWRCKIGAVDEDTENEDGDEDKRWRWMMKMRRLLAALAHE